MGHGVRDIRWVFAKYFFQNLGPLPGRSGLLPAWIGRTNASNRGSSSVPSGELWRNRGGEGLGRTHAVPSSAESCRRLRLSPGSSAFVRSGVQIPSGLVAEEVVATSGVCLSPRPVCDPARGVHYGR